MLTDGAGGALIADGNNGRIRRLWANNTLTTLFQAGLGQPYAIASDGVGGYLIPDTNTMQLRRQLPTNAQVLLAGNNTRGYADGNVASQTMLFNPYYAAPGEAASRNPN